METKCRRPFRVSDENVDRVIEGLREYYRREFVNGESDESFLVWMGGKVEVIAPDAVIAASAR